MNFTFIVCTIKMKKVFDFKNMNFNIFYIYFKSVKKLNMNLFNLFNLIKKSVPYFFNKTLNFENYTLVICKIKTKEFVT